jgi:hypothetical protein
MPATHRTPPAPTALMPSCPDCGQRMWDNRTTKKNPRAPDFKCCSKDCEGAIWPDDKQWGRAGSAWIDAPQSLPLEAGPGQDNGARESRDNVPPPVDPDEEEFLRDAKDAESEESIRQYAHLLQVLGSKWMAFSKDWPERMQPTAADVQAAAATIAINAARRV